MINQDYVRSAARAMYESLGLKVEKIDVCLNQTIDEEEVISRPIRSEYSKTEMRQLLEENATDFRSALSLLLNLSKIFSMTVSKTTRFNLEILYTNSTSINSLLHQIARSASLYAEVVRNPIKAYVLGMRWIEHHSDKRIVDILKSAQESLENSAENKLEAYSRGM